MLNEKSTASFTAESASGLTYPGPALDIEDCIIESNTEGFNKTFQHMMQTHGKGPWLNQALYLVCTGDLFGIDPDARQEMFNTLIEHFDPSIDGGVDMYLSVALAQAPWAVEPMMKAIRTRMDNTEENRQHLALIACQKAIEGHIQATHLAAPDLFLNHDLSELFWRKTFSDKRARKTLWSDGQWMNNPALDRLLDMPKCATADHHVARGLFNQAANSFGHEDTIALAVHLVNRGWLTAEATAIAMAGVQHGDQQENEAILAKVVSAQLQRRTNMLSAAAPAPRM